MWRKEEVVLASIASAAHEEVCCSGTVLEQWPRVHSSVVRAADCRSAGPWFKSGCALLQFAWYLVLGNKDSKDTYLYPPCLASTFIKALR